MGVGASVDLAVPPGGSTLVLMNPTECFQTKPKIDSTQKPLCLSMLGDAEWNEWMGKLQNIVNQYLSEMLPFFLVPLAFVAVIATMAFPGIPIYAMFLVLFPFVLHNRRQPFLHCLEKPRSGKKTEGCILGACCQEISCIINVPLFHSKTCWNRHISFQKRPGTFCSPKDC